MTPSRRCALSLNRAEDDLLRVFELLLATEVAVFEDELARLLEAFSCGVEIVAEEQTRAVEVDVSEVERHRSALGDLLRRIEVSVRLIGAALHYSQPRAGEKPARETVHLPGLAETLHRVVKVRGQLRMPEVGRRFF